MRHTLWPRAMLAVGLAACARQAELHSHPAGAIVVQGREMIYLTDSITVTAGEAVTLVFENVGALEHGLMIDELGVEIEHILPGRSGTAAFTPEAPGSFAFYCNVPGHRQANMAGVLTVVP